MDTEINRRIGKASGTFQLSGSVWDNPKSTIHTKSAVYCACIYSTVLQQNMDPVNYAEKEN